MDLRVKLLVSPEVLGLFSIWNFSSTVRIFGVQLRTKDYIGRVRVLSSPACHGNLFILFLLKFSYKIRNKGSFMRNPRFIL